MKSYISHVKTEQIKVWESGFPKATQPISTKRVEERCQLPKPGGGCLRNAISGF